jgi:hypothetical protein
MANKTFDRNRASKPLSALTGGQKKPGGSPRQRGPMETAVAPAEPVRKLESPIAPVRAQPSVPTVEAEPAIRVEPAAGKPAVPTGHETSVATAPVSGGSVPVTHTPAEAATSTPTADVIPPAPAETTAAIAAPLEAVPVEAVAPAAAAAPTEPTPVAVEPEPLVEIAEPAPVVAEAEPVVEMMEPTPVMAEAEPVVDIVEPVPEPPPEQPAEPPPDPYRYIPPPFENKYLNKEALREIFMPIICYVGRLDHQKGVHLIKHGIFYALRNGAQFVLLGVSPDPRINEDFWNLKRQLNDNPDCHLEIGFNEELSHLIYAGSDMMIMPSLYEPCGLSQMIALKYGTVPIVREVGGLADTVFDKDYSHKALHERNGFVFQGADPQGLESAMYRAIGLWYSYPEHFRYLVQHGMQYDYSWSRPGQDYLNIYEHIRAK